MSIYDTGIRPLVDAHLAKLAEEKRDYGEFWSASSAGHCMRRVIFERLDIPHTKEDPRKQRVFSAGDVFHEWIQRITKDAGLSIAQELRLQDEKLMIRGHVDDLVQVDGQVILYDYKSTHSDSFHRGKNRYPLSQYHKMQVATYMYMLRTFQKLEVKPPNTKPYNWSGFDNLPPVSEARILKISKDDLCMDEHQLLWSPALEKEVVGYWTTLNGYWKNKKIPACTCHLYEGGFMSREAFNPFWYQGQPCSLEHYKIVMAERRRIAA